jgi:hypothetical protein
LPKLLIVSPLFQTCSFFLNAVALALRITAAVWMQRLQSADDRITDVARIELASFGRLLKTGSRWLENEESTTLSGCESRLCQQICEQEGIAVNDVNREAVVMTGQLLMALKGPVTLISFMMEWTHLFKTCKQVLHWRTKHS